jgi:maleylpyruvate isomerase
MTGSSISPEASVRAEGVPAQRTLRERPATDRATRCLAAVRVATARLETVVSDLDDAAMRGPSLLPGWSRAHVVSHLARNADALVNLLTWARTGVEHPMYASRADRDADIEEGAERLAQVLREDVRAASDRFSVAADRLTETQWQATVAAWNGRTFPASDVPYMRLFEVWTHLVDLDAGFAFTDVPAEQLESLTGLAVSRMMNRDDGPSMTLLVTLPNGTERRWDVTGGAAGPVHEISGDAAAVIGWLTSRTDGTGLTGDLPTLPAWG